MTLAIDLAQDSGAHGPVVFTTVVADPILRKINANCYTCLALRLLLRQIEIRCVSDNLMSASHKKTLGSSEQG